MRCVFLEEDANCSVILEICQIGKNPRVPEAAGARLFQQETRLCSWSLSSRRHRCGDRETFKKKKKKGGRESNAQSWKSRWTQGAVAPPPSAASRLFGTRSPARRGDAGADAPSDGGRGFHFLFSILAPFPSQKKAQGFLLFFSLSETGEKEGRCTCTASETDSLYTEALLSPVSPLN